MDAFLGHCGGEVAGVVGEREVVGGGVGVESAGGVGEGSEEAGCGSETACGAGE